MRVSKGRLSTIVANYNEVASRMRDFMQKESCIHLIKIRIEQMCIRISHCNICKHFLLETYFQARLFMRNRIYAILDTWIVQKKKQIARDMLFLKH